MGTIFGLMLVLGTWALLVCVLAAFGLFPALVTEKRVAPFRTLRHSLWWGLALVTIFALALNNVAPLGSGVVAGFFLGSAVLLACLVVVLRKRGIIVALGHMHLLKLRKHEVILCISMMASVFYFAAAALGRVTNYDSGLYHLGAIEYSRLYSTIPGLANLHSPFGYSNAEFPLAALLGNGPWQEQGFRLINGFLALLLVIELLLRMQEKKRGAGFYVLLVGIFAAFVPMIVLSDYWVTSPSQDSAVLFLTIAASAYLADICVSKKPSISDFALVGILSLLLVMLRPTMVVFALIAIGIGVLKLWKKRAEYSRKSVALTGISVGVFGLAALVVLTVRDYFLSGWLQYPLSIYHFDVSWLAQDPIQLRMATLGYHRNPDELWNSTTGWGWVGPWLSRVPTNWEFYEFLGLLALLLGILVLAWHRNCRLHWKSLTLTMIPSVFAVCFWWVATPPSFRFVWGPLFTCATIPIGISIWRLKASAPKTKVFAGFTIGRVMQIGISTALLLLVCICVPLRLHLNDNKESMNWNFGVSIPYSVTPVTRPDTTDASLASGIQLKVPVKSEQCWQVFPLCSPRVPQGLRFVNETIQSGFVQ